MKKVAIIGAGIVGATAAYYLSKESYLEITVFDHGHGQATKVQRELSVLGFPNAAIEPGTSWRAWVLTFMWICWLI